MFYIYFASGKKEMLVLWDEIKENNTYCFLPYKSGSSPLNQPDNLCSLPLLTWKNNLWKTTNFRVVVNIKILIRPEILVSQ